MARAAIVAARLDGQACRRVEAPEAIARRDVARQKQLLRIATPWLQTQLVRLSANAMTLSPYPARAG